MFDSLLLLAQVALGTAESTNIHDLQSLGLFPIDPSDQAGTASGSSAATSTDSAGRPSDSAHSTDSAGRPSDSAHSSDSAGRPSDYAGTVSGYSADSADGPSDSTDSTEVGRPRSSPRRDTSAGTDPPSATDHPKVSVGQEPSLFDSLSTETTPLAGSDSPGSEALVSSPEGSGRTSATGSHPESSLTADTVEECQPGRPSLKTPQRRARRQAARVKMIIRVDLPALLRGLPMEGETCELVGYGPIAVSVIEDLLATQNPFITAVLTNHHQVLGVSHQSRRPNAYQQTALEWLYPTCAAKGCNAKVRLERDHRVDWHKTYFTALDLLDLLCAHHHKLKTRANWALAPGHGKRDFVPPSDRRHPKHAGSASSQDLAQTRAQRRTQAPAQPPADPP